VTRPQLAIDLCAGIGWSIATHALGIAELGIEIMPEAIATRSAMGAMTLQHPDGSGVSMSDLPDAFCSQAPIQIAGPPCQTFSPAGSGEGRRQISELVRRIQHLQRTGHLERGGSGDPRTWLVLEPLRLALGGLPAYVVWEQVPSVLPVWQACGSALTAVGYSVWTGILRSEQYGVPQTRKRAFLIARRDGVQAAPPVPTHSQYYERNRSKLDADVLPWVSMAEALGWGTTGRPSFTVTGGGSNTGGAEPYGRRAREALLAYRSSVQPNATVRDENQPAPTVLFGNDAASVQWVYRNGTHDHAAERPIDTPAPTVMFGARSNAVRWVTPAQSIRVTVEEAAALQTFPYPELIQGKQGKRYLQVGNMVPPLLGKAVLTSLLAL
jgi:DNA (cytosine-5)-methyltransferase 1